MEYLSAHPALLVAAVLLAGLFALRIVAKLACLATLVVAGLILLGVAGGLARGVL